MTHFLAKYNTNKSHSKVLLDDLIYLPTRLGIVYSKSKAVEAQMP